LLGFKPPNELFLPSWTTVLVIGYITLIPMSLGNDALLCLCAAACAKKGSLNFYSETLSVHIVSSNEEQRLGATDYKRPLSEKLCWTAFGRLLPVI
jgi:hypothetical protein